MDIVNAVELHRKMWDEIYKNNYESKESVTSVSLSGVHNHCFLCQWLKESVYVDKDKSVGRILTIRECEIYCPLKWPGNKEKRSICYGPSGLWSIWKDYNIDSLAKDIRDLPVREIYKHCFGKKEELFFKNGDVIEVEDCMLLPFLGKFYLLVEVNNGHMSLISLSHPGCRWGNPFKVKDVKHISVKELGTFLEIRKYIKTHSLKDLLKNEV